MILKVNTIANYVKVLALLILIVIFMGKYIEINNTRLEEVEMQLEHSKNREESLKNDISDLKDRNNELLEEVSYEREKTSDGLYGVDRKALANEILGFDINEIDNIDKSGWYYYSLLDQRQKEIYIELLKNVPLQKECNIKNSSEEEINLIFRYIGYDHETLFYISWIKVTEIEENYITCCGIPYNEFYSVERIYDAWLEIKDFRDDALRNINSFQSLEEKEKQIFNYIVTHTNYIKGSEYNQTLYSVALGDSVCAGYGKMFKYLCDEVGLPCICVKGELKETQGGHLWNMVRINDIYYMVDTTNALIQTESGEWVINYNYFNTSSDVMENHYKIYYEQFFYPETIGG